VSPKRYIQVAYRSVQRWYGGVDLLKMKFVFVPVADRMH
ncbi:unnamed protein product, partial [Ectocarpus sp. 12 AP-2014]